jgi:acyl carrier protein
MLIKAPIKRDGEKVDTIRNQLLEFICRSYMVSEDDIKLDESLVDQGIIDSFGLVELSAFIERNFAFKISDADMTRDNFGSVIKMTNFISRSVGGAP